MEIIQLEARGAVAWVWLNRPDRLNAMNANALADLRRTFEAVQDDGNTRAVVLAGRGAAFCSGFDVEWMAGLEAEAVDQQMGAIEAVYDTIESCAKPVIAAVHGAVLGGGLLLALVADLRLAAEGTSFGTPEVRLGFFPPLSLVSRLERVVGLGAAKYLVLTGSAVAAAEARVMGLVDKVLPAERLHAETQLLAEHLAGLPTTAVQLAKAAFAATGRPDYTAWERAQFAVCWARPEREAAMRAFLASR
jgi:enoyl-CoA hydratase/carnithine racemase